MIEFWAEAGPCGNDVKKAIEYVHAIREAGAHAIKVQWYRPETLVLPGTPRYDNTSGSAKTQSELFANAIYPYERWEPVIQEARVQGIQFIPSVFDLEAVDVAANLGITTLKIASGDITYSRLIATAADFVPRVAISTGAATAGEVRRAVRDATNALDLIVMACHLEYPTSLEYANVARIHAIRELHLDLTDIGFSDHTPGIDTIPLAVAAGAGIIEKHFTLEANQGYDSDFALTPADLRNAVLAAQKATSLMGDQELAPSPGEQAARLGARRSLYASTSLAVGETLTHRDVVPLRPYVDGSLSPAELVAYVGGTLTLPLNAGEPLTREHFTDSVD